MHSGAVSVGSTSRLRPHHTHEVTDEPLAEGAHVVHVTGEFDRATADEFERVVDRVLGAGTQRLVVDLSRTTFLDSSALASLVHSSRRLRGDGCALVVVATADQPLDKFDLSGTRAFFHLCDTVEEAQEVAVIEPATDRPPARRPTLAPEDDGALHLRLYLNGRSHHAVEARAALEELRDLHLPPAARVEIVDIHEQPEVAERERILATPMLTRVRPGPVRKVVGDLHDLGAVARALELSTGRVR